ncbi:MAG: DEAD/DEAH box helicase [Spirochaetales bacterium]|nr:DEAD/DEAH box helicase [Spirochaetales bacterium]
MEFEELGLKPELLRAADSKGYKTTTPIQAQAIPAIIKGKDVLGGAQTGTGKTAAFALPILNRLSNTTTKSRHPRALILTPTRELADQVGESFINYGKYLSLRSIKIYGGVKINPQITNLRNGTDIVIATPGRLLDHLQQKTINLSGIETLVLDEADRMLDMGFINDIKKILRFLPSDRQNLLFSATFGNNIKALAKGILKDPVSVEVAKRNSAADKVEQLIHYVDKNQKRHLLAHLIKEGTWYRVLIFVKTKHGANRLTSQFNKEGIPSAAIHGNKSQAARTRALQSFIRGDIQALIATDVAARGLHLEDLSHVVNFDLPNIPEDYIHRIGRTGRAGKSGIAISLVSHEDKQHLQKIERLLKNTVPVGRVDSFKPVFLPAVKDNRPAGNNHAGKSNNRATHNNKPRKFKPKSKAIGAFGPKESAPGRRRKRSA